MKYTVYQMTNTVNKKIYVGKHQTKDINDGYMGSGKLLKHAIKKYGIENFIKDILHVFDTEEEMNAKEADLVTEEFCLRKDTYNICNGGQGGFSHIIRDTETHKLSASKGGTASKIHGNKFKNLTAWNSPEALEKKVQTYIENIKCGKYKPSFTGKKHTDETKQKMRKPKNVGINNSQYGSFWVTNGYENKKLKSVDCIPEGWYKGRVIINERD